MTIYKDKASDRYRYDFQLLGTRYQSKLFRKKRSAASAEEAKKKQVLHEAAEKKKTATGFKHCANLYLDVAQRKFAKKTYKYKKYVYKCFLAEKGNLDIFQIDEHHIGTYLLTRPTNSNYNFHRKDLHALFEYVRVELKYRPDNPVTRVARMPHDTRRPNIPTRRQVAALLLAAQPDEYDFIMCVLLSYARVDEIQRLCWEDISFSQKSLIKYTKKRKGGEYRPIVVAMSKDLENILTRRWVSAGRPVEGLVFVNSKTGKKFNNRRKMIKGLCRRAFDPGCKSIKKYDGPLFTFKHLRHFIASFLYDEKKMSVGVIGELLGHTEERTTENYLHRVSERSRIAADAVDGEFTDSIQQNDEADDDRQDTK